MSDSQPANISVRDFLAALPPQCIGSQRLLSRALYRLSHDHLQIECVGAVYRLAERYGRDATLDHLLLLPDFAFHWITGGFIQALDDQADSLEPDLIAGVHFVTFDHKSGFGHQTPAPKSWAEQFLRDALQQRSPSPKNATNLA